MTPVPETQKALAIPGPEESYELIQRTVPRPGHGEVLIKLEATGLNPAEWKFLGIDLRALVDVWGLSKAYPAFVGQDGAGIVVDVGEGVVSIDKGDRVTLQGWLEENYTTYQEYALAPEGFIAKIPSSMSFLQAASLPSALVTAAIGLAVPFSPPSSGGLGLKGFWEADAEGYYKGQTILIFGGSSSVGQFVIQIASYIGFSTIITTSSVKHADFLRGLGATHVVDRNGDVAAELKKIHGDNGFKYIYDAVHAPISQTEVDFLAPGGMLLSILSIPGDVEFADDRKAVAVWGSVHLHKDVGRKMFATLPEFLEKGIIKPNRVEKVSDGLAGIREALKRLETGQVSGHKLAVNPAETPDVV
ncbi:hypothetical protein HGRIS_004511 [Hohenbuehelia grisea]|uniref:Enoyl reductase (ER) domain-containing protein n=1 Tax=Hohenbuehelia grisea TaxID=104357 RepID=A0ABR3JDB3_9AGAR